MAPSSPFWVLALWQVSRCQPRRQRQMSGATASNGRITNIFCGPAQDVHAWPPRANSTVRRYKSITHFQKDDGTALAVMQTLCGKLVLIVMGTTMSIKALLRLARATTVAAVTVAASGSPVFAAVSQVALHLASVRCEKERLRQKVAEALYAVRIQSVSCQWALDWEARSNNQVLQEACPEASSGS